LDAKGQTGAWNTGNRNVFEGWGISGHANYEVSDSLNLQSITAYRTYNNKWGSDDDFTPNPAIAAGGYNDLDFWFFSQELRLNGKIGDLVEYTLGGFYSDQKSTYYTIQDIRYFPYSVDPLQFVGNDPVNADTIAAFGTVIVRPTDSLTLTGGLRYTEEHKDYTFVRRRLDYSQGPVGGHVEDLDGVPSVYDGNRVDWRISADYRFNEQLLAYATVSTGFKGGGVTARPFYPEHATKGTFKPETVTSYEIGLKTDLFDRRLRFNVSGFFNDYKDIQLGLSDCTAYGGIATPCAVRANAGDGEIWGVEAELFAEPIDGLTIDGSLSLLDSKYTYLAKEVGTSVTLDDPIVSPTFQGSFGIQYKADLGDKGSITPRFDISYRDKQYMGHSLDKVSTDLRYLDAYTLGSARLTYRNADEDVEVSLEVTNLFDEYYTPTRFAALYSLTGTAYSTVGAPREWRVSVKKTF
ncbi:MAG TPA: TonB-dependent receptor, partial [Sphingomonadaceae bacterium]|nr:TonB-dependent receptor [Sphingomonadaceae bacterium]